MQRNLWHEFAGEDLRMAELALREKLYNQVCFHCQQAAEKLIKGLLAEMGKAPPKSHRIADLLAQAAIPSTSAVGTSSILLDRFYLATRYPDALPPFGEHVLPTEEDARKALEAVCALQEWVRARQPEG